MNPGKPTAPTIWTKFVPHTGLKTFVEKPTPLQRFLNRIHACFPANPVYTTLPAPGQITSVMDDYWHMARKLATPTITAEELMACMGLADLFLDDKLDIEDYRFVGTVLVEAGVTHRHGFDLLRNVVFPLLASNLFGTSAGVWGCWDTEVVMNGLRKVRNRNMLHSLLSELWAASMWADHGADITQKYEKSWRHSRNPDENLD